MKCIILAAGYATRLYPLTENFPKPLLKVGEKTILDWLVDDVGAAADKYIVVSNHKYAGYFISWASKKVLNGAFPEITVLDDGSTTNDNRLGAVIDIQFAIKSLSLQDDLLVIAGDNVLDFSFHQFIDYAKSKDTSCTMRYYEGDVNRIRKSGASIVDENDRLIEMQEKPAQPKSNWCTPPFYYYKAADCSKIKEAIADGCGTDAPGSLAGWMCRHTVMHSMIMPGKRYDIGNMESYRTVQEEYKGITVQNKKHN